MKILIIDSNEDFFPLYARKLAPLTSGITPTMCVGLEGLLQLAACKPDCIIVSHRNLHIYEDIRKLGYAGPIIIAVAGKDKLIKRNYLNGISGIIDKGLNGEDFRKQFLAIYNSKQPKLCREASQ
jgi:hypothetical protein